MAGLQRCQTLLVCLLNAFVVFPCVAASMESHESGAARRLDNNVYFRILKYVVI